MIEFPKTIHSIEITGENWQTASKVYVQFSVMVPLPPSVAWFQ